MFGVWPGPVVVLLLLLSFDGVFNRLQGRQRGGDAFLPPLLILRLFRGRRPLRRLGTTSSSSRRRLPRPPRSPTSLRRRLRRLVGAVVILLL